MGTSTKQIEQLLEEAICLPTSKHPRVVIIGGGFAGLSMVKHLKKKKVQVVLIDKNNYHTFQPLLYQVATSELEVSSIGFPIRKQTSKHKNVYFRLAEVEEISTEKKLISTSRGPIDYDYLVLATGTETNFFGMDRIKKNSLGMKSLLDSIKIRHKMLHNLELAVTCNEVDREALVSFVVVGGGPAGVEMAGALAEFRRYILPKDFPEYPAFSMRVYLIEGSDKLIASMSEKASKKTLKFLKKLDVEVLFEEIVTDYDGHVVTMKSGKRIRTKNVVWTAGVKGQAPDGIKKEHFARGNRITTNAFNQLNGLDNVFAIGDIAIITTEDTPDGHPQVAQPAIQQGKNVAKNILNIINNKRLKPFKYVDKGSLATVGRHRAVADLGKLKFGGYLAWLLWLFVHLMSISGFRNRFFVGLNWAISYFSYEKSSRLIIADLWLKKESKEKKEE